MIAEQDHTHRILLIPSLNANPRVVHWADSWETGWVPKYHLLCEPLGAICYAPNRFTHNHKRLWALTGAFNTQRPIPINHWTCWILPILPIPPILQTVTTPTHHLVVHKADDHLVFTFFQADSSAGRSQLNNYQCTTVVADLCSFNQHIQHWPATQLCPQPAALPHLTHDPYPCAHTWSVASIFYFLWFFHYFPIPISFTSDPHPQFLFLLSWYLSLHLSTYLH